MSFTLDQLAEIIVNELTPFGAQGTSIIRSISMSIINKYNVPSADLVSALERKGFKLVIGPCTLCLNDTVKDSFQGCKGCGKSIHSMCGVNDFCDSRCRIDWLARTKV